jgi:hypothetical protein
MRRLSHPGGRPVSDALVRASGALAMARWLVDDLKSDQDTISIDDARQLIHIIRETEGWLLSAKTLLDPTEVL